MLSDLHAIFSDITLMNKIEPPISFYKSIRLHNGAIDNDNSITNLSTMSSSSLSDSICEMILKTSMLAQLHMSL